MPAPEALVIDDVTIQVVVTTPSARIASETKPSAEKPATPDHPRC
jgi:hypothetical protein